jgi:hypothetical protein
MPVLIQVCVVLSTLALLSLVGMTVRMMSRFLTATNQVSNLGQSVRQSLARLDRATDELAALSATMSNGLEPVLRVVDHMEAVGHRALDLSSAILEELAPPVLTAVAVTRGMRSAAGHLMKLLMNRVSRSRSPISGGNHHE